MLSLLSLWLHCTAYFFVTTVLFKGQISRGLGEASLTHQQAGTIQVRLLTANVPAPPAVPDVQPETATPEPQEKIPVRSSADDPPPVVQPETAIPEHQENILPRSTAENPQVDEQPKEGAPENNALACDSLAKKPERIIFGDDYVEFMPDGNSPGYMVLHETIHRDGTVIAVTIDDSTMSKKMEGQVIAWAYRSFYHPGEIGGIAVDCDMKFVVSPTPYSKP